MHQWCRPDFPSSVIMGPLLYSTFLTPPLSNVFFLFLLRFTHSRILVRPPPTPHQTHTNAVATYSCCAPSLLHLCMSVQSIPPPPPSPQAMPTITNRLPCPSTPACDHHEFRFRFESLPALPPSLVRFSPTRPSSLLRNFRLLSSTLFYPPSNLTSPFYSPTPPPPSVPCRKLTIFTSALGPDKEDWFGKKETQGDWL